MKATWPSSLPMCSSRCIRYVQRSRCSAEHEAHALPATNGRRRRELHAAVVDVPLGKAIEQLVERDSPFEAGEVGAEAVVQAEPEGEVADVLAMDVEDVGVVVAARVAVGRSHQ